MFPSSAAHAAGVMGPVQFMAAWQQSWSPSGSDVDSVTSDDSTDRMHIFENASSGQQFELTAGARNVPSTCHPVREFAPYS